jgi:hypothetical protein
MAPTSYSAIYAPQSTTHRDNVYADTGEPFEPPATVYAYNEGRLQDELYGDYEADIPVNAANSMVRGDEPSRTMQLAYNDPCECFFSGYRRQLTVRRRSDQGVTDARPKCRLRE